MKKQSRHGVKDTQGNSPDTGSKTHKETVQTWGSKTHKETAQTGGQRHNFLKHNSQRTRTHQRLKRRLILIRQYPAGTNLHIHISLKLDSPQQNTMQTEEVLMM